VIVRNGRRLEYCTVGLNAIEGLIGVLAAMFAGSISLIGFGMDSFIEVTSGSVLLWRLTVDGNPEGRRRNEKRALQAVHLPFGSGHLYHLRVRDGPYNPRNALIVLRYFQASTKTLRVQPYALTAAPLHL
jgi:hypothetical protein